MKVKIPQKNANMAQIMSYSEAHQKFGHPGEELTKATAMKLGWKLSSKTEECGSCPIGNDCQKKLNKIAR